MADVLAEFTRLLSGLSDREKRELDKLLEPELRRPWLPSPGPQTEAFLSKADLLLYGGAAGGGKTDLLCGLALTEHRRSVIFRRQADDLRGFWDRLLALSPRNKAQDGNIKRLVTLDGRLIECGHLEKPGSELSWQGRPHDFIGFDEGAQLTAQKVSFVMGWNRSAEGLRCRVVIASNPPIGGEGNWLLEWFAPWLDPMFPQPAAPGELRWAYVIGKGDEIRSVWVDGPDPVEVGGELYEPLSRTFIPSRLDDNPYLRDTGYRARINAMPEPLRSQLLYGDFLAGQEDHDWQVIPSAWIDAAFERWEKAETKTRKMIALAADIALGGNANTVLASLHTGAWFAPLVVIPGSQCKDPIDIASQIVKHRRDSADLSVDMTGGWGSGVRSHLINNQGMSCHGVVFSGGSDRLTKDGKLGFRNLRAQMWWSLREALDPQSGEDLKLPPDQRLRAELMTPRYQLRGTDILIEDKEAIEKRAGGSIDRADAVVMAWHRRSAAVVGPKIPKPNTEWVV